MGALVFQLHGVADDGDDLAGTADGGSCGQDVQAYLAALGAANQLDHFVQPPANHVDHLVATLADAQSAVRRF